MRDTQAARRHGRGALGAATVACLGLMAAAGVEAQDAVPRVPAGVKIAVMPVQSVAPAPSGAWPGGAASGEEARRRMDAELAFALSSSGGAGEWPGPRELAAMVERNPTIDADPRRLAVGRLMDGGPEDGRLRDPLHRQLRRLSALADVRMTAIPLRLSWRAPEPTDGPADTAGPASRPAPGRAVLELALVDTRSARILWRGEVRGAEGPPDEPGTLARLAGDLVRLLAP